jgi:hypothetical protein
VGKVLEGGRDLNLEQVRRGRRNAACGLILIPCPRGPGAELVKRKPTKPEDHRALICQGHGLAYAKGRLPL